MVADHLSRLVNEEVTLKEAEIKDEFLDESLFLIAWRPWFADMANFKAVGIIPKDLTWQQQNFFFHDARFYIWDDPHLFKVGANNLLRRCVTSEEAKGILWHCYNSPCGGHYDGDKTATKVLQSGFFWPTLFKDAHHHVLMCDQCQRMGGISRRNEMPLQNIMEVEVFYCWGTDFMVPFPSSVGNEYILVTVDYVSKWVEAVITPGNDAKVLVKFIKKNIFVMLSFKRC